MSEGAAATRKRPAGLGRGLSALLGEAVREVPVDERGDRAPGVRMLPIEQISPNPDQPRRHFDEAALDELAQSIAARGLIQPIVVRPFGDAYQIVAGERRWRAAQRARLHQLPVIIREFDDADTLEIALLENIQRQELNAIEEAEAYRKLIDRFGHSQDVLGKLVDKSRSHVSNLMRLLDLPPAVRSAVADNRLSMGHARALVTARDPEALARTGLERGLSVRDTERLARVDKGSVARTRVRLETPHSPDADVIALERQLGDILGLKVKIAHVGVGGSVTLSYSTLDQLDLICQRLTGERI